MPVEIGLFGRPVSEFDRYQIFYFCSPLEHDNIPKLTLVRGFVLYQYLDAVSGLFLWQFNIQRNVTFCNYNCTSRFALVRNFNGTFPSRSEQCSSHLVRFRSQVLLYRSNWFLLT